MNAENGTPTINRYLSSKYTPYTADPHSTTIKNTDMMSIDILIRSITADLHIKYSHIIN